VWVNLCVCAAVGSSHGECVESGGVWGGVEKLLNLHACVYVVLLLRAMVYVYVCVCVCVCDRFRVY